MFRKDGKRAKQKILNTQKEYERITKEINKYSNCYIFLSVQYYTWWKVIGHIITLGAILKKRRSRASHTASIYKFGADPRIIEATGRYGGVNHRGLYDAYFLPQFHGKVVAYIISCNFTDRDRVKRSDRLEHKDLGTIYCAKKAYRSWFDFFKEYFKLGKEQKDTSDEVYCTDYMLDDYEISTRTQLLGNNAEITPAELGDFLNGEPAIRFIVRDTK